MIHYQPATIPLSTAILLGSITSWQAFHGWHSKQGGRCVLGAALDAIGLLDSVVKSDDWHRILTELWPILSTIGVEYGDVLLHELIRLNDYRRWPRQQIAAYVKQIEGQQQPQAVEQLVRTEMVT